MIICQRHLDVQYGRQGDALADFEAALAGMSDPPFRRHSDALAPLIVPGSQHWVVYRVLEEPRA